ncbi:Ankyrin-3 [Madurella mycetomatis]|uniref:Ankyrin-3 n=1 Tax=Madurella mycetomatis TaxID=100816 RepID=A0A175VQD5_9PEZI|nr:Ankyrin-3 [Madurella mycetomatis]
MDWSAEFSAAISLPSQTCRSLLKNGADPNARDLDHWTPLYYACRIIKPVSGVDSFVDGFYYQPRARQRAKALILHKADANARGLDSSTPLHCAAASRSLGLVDLLLEHGSEANATNFEGRTPLHLAATTNKASVVSNLIATGAHIDAKDQADRTLLHLAAMSGAAECINELIKRGASPNAQDRFRGTPLSVASIYNSYEGIEALLHARTAEGAPIPIDIDAGNARGGTALHGAASANACRAIKAFYTVKGPNFAINLEPREIDVEAAGLLMTYMERDSWPPTNDSGRTPFHVAAEYGNPEIIVKMIKKANQLHFAPEGILRKGGAYSATALSMAVSNGNLNAVQALLKVRQLATTGTPMERLPPAASDRSAGDGILQRLLEERDNEGRTPLALAVECRETTIVLELVNQGADISVGYKNGQNLLHRAASDGTTEIARAIIENRFQELMR